MTETYSKQINEIIALNKKEIISNIIDIILFIFILNFFISVIYYTHNSNN